MVIHNHPLSWYIERLKSGPLFAMTSLGDGEWIAIMKQKVGGENAEGTIYSPELCEALIKTLHDRSLIHSTPDDLKYLGLPGQIDNWLAREGLSDLEFVEKDVFNKAAVNCELSPFLEQLASMRVCVISNEAMRGLYFLKAQHVEVGYPNAFLDLDRAVDEAASVYQPGMVYIVAMGLAGPVLVSKLHARAPDAFILEIGSILDAFTGMGGQRGSRAELYGDPRKLMAWRRKNLAFLYDRKEPA